MDKELFIVRHGETEFNKLKIVQGSGVDSSLNETGQAQAQALYGAYKDYGFELVVTSALVRTTETASHFIADGIPHLKDADINEISWGIYEGKSSAAGMKEAYVDLIASWNNEDYDARTEGGESAAEMSHRLGRFLAWVKARKEKKILVVMHGRSIRCLMCLVEGKAIKHMDQYHHHNTGIYKVLQKGDDLEVVQSNNIDHLAELKSHE